jgi:serine/threonine protein kinase
MHDLGVVHGNLEIVSRCVLFGARHVFTFPLLQTNVLVDSKDTPRIAGLGSALIHWQSSPFAWSDDSHELARCSAPELVNPEAFGLSGPQATEASDMYAFGVLAYHVSICSPRFPHTGLKMLVIDFCG